MRRVDSHLYNVNVNPRCITDSPDIYHALTSGALAPARSEMIESSKDLSVEVKLVETLFPLAIGSQDATVGELAGVQLGGAQLGWEEAPLIVATFTALSVKDLLRFRTSIFLVHPDPVLGTLAQDLGHLWLRDIAHLSAALALEPFDEPWRATAGGLSALMRRRLAQAAPGRAEAESSQSLRLGESNGRLFLESSIEHGGQKAQRTASFSVEHMAAALEAHEGRNSRELLGMPKVEDAEPERVLEVLFGPKRSLSDPASKVALREYDLPLPKESFCGSASRAAAEAQSIGFPVRVTLASPDLRASDHPELEQPHVSSASAVRQAFRALTEVASDIAPSSRVIGVNVAASAIPKALLWFRLSALAQDRVVAHLGFADPHGMASEDRVAVLVPVDADRIRARFRRLKGASLVSDAVIEDELVDLLYRASVFVADFRTEVQRLELGRVAIYESSVEIIECTVHISDAFERTVARL